MSEFTRCLLLPDFTLELMIIDDTSFANKNIICVCLSIAYSLADIPSAMTVPAILYQKSPSLSSYSFYVYILFYCLFLVVPWVGLLFVMVAFPGSFFS